MSVEEIYIHSIQSLEFIKLGAIQAFLSLLLMFLPWRLASGHETFFFSFKYNYDPPKKDEYQWCQL